jgi:hypothetical protein
MPGPDNQMTKLTIHSDSGTYRGWEELKIHVIGTNFEQENRASQIRLRVLAADVYNVFGPEVSRNPQCGPITDYQVNCPTEQPTTSFNFSIVSDPAGLEVETYIAFSDVASQTPNESEFLFTAQWNELCDDYVLEDGEMFCIEASVDGAFPLISATNNSTNSSQICGGTNASCVSWAGTDELGQEIVVFYLDGSNVKKDPDLRYSSNVLFCAANGETIFRWDPTLTVNFDSQEGSLTDVASAASSLPLRFVL